MRTWRAATGVRQWTFVKPTTTSRSIWKYRRCRRLTSKSPSRTACWSVTGERKYEKKTKGKVHRVERHYGRFTRSFRLPENADESHIEANAKDGVLYLKVAKRAEVKPRAIEVKVH